MAASAQNHAITSADGQHAGSYSMMLRSLKQRYEWFVFGYELSACNYFNYSFTVFKPIQSPAHSLWEFPKYWSVLCSLLSIDDILPGISVQVQKVIQGLEDTEDSQATSSTHCKLEPVLEISPKVELPDVRKNSKTITI